MATDADRLVHAAAQALQAGDAERARGLCTDALTQDGAHAQALLMLGLIEQQQQAPAAAMAWLARAVRAAPESADAWALQGQVQRVLAQHAEALASYGRALALQPARLDLLFNKGNLLRELARHEEAIASYDAALAISAADAVVLNNRAVALHALGRYEEALESLAAALAARPGYADALNNRGNALQALGLHDLAGQAFDDAIAAQPGHAQAWNNRGNALESRGRLDEALASYEQAAAADPAYADPWCNRATVLGTLGRGLEALASSDGALRRRPQFAQALAARGRALQSLGRGDEALQAFTEAFRIEPSAAAARDEGDAMHALGLHAEALERYNASLRMDPRQAETLVHRGNALQGLGRHEDALACYGQAIALRPHDVQAHWNEALARLALGDLRRGFEKYEWRWQNPRLDLPPGADPARSWSGDTALEARSILLYAEQGFGDAIQFVRYAPRVAALGARVSLVCHESLREVFQSVEGVERVYGPGDALPDFELQSPLMSLPLAFRTELDTIPAQVPYLHVDVARVAHWRERLASVPGARKVGLAWTGNPEFPGARAKSCPVESLRRLLQADATGWVSLQTGHASGDSSVLAIADWTAELNSFADTAALIGALDLVITIDTAVAHLAGALGKPVWILLPHSADWRWLRTRTDSPWYPSAVLFRQSRAGDWDAPLDAVLARLAAR